ncbi:hypothetical protein FRC01_014021 [Tulasnella sp. 417]|nr:hypothetical protein FRC01_014021 [Tulasnella sp. 417]
MNSESNTATKRKAASGQKPDPADEQDNIPMPPMVTGITRGRAGSGDTVALVPPHSGQKDDNDKSSNQTASKAT